MNDLFNHLWQSTAFAVAVAAATALLRRNSPRLRYWLWLAASIKFLVPFSLLVATGARVQLPRDTPSLHATTVQQISTYFSPAFIAAPAHAVFPWMKLLAAIWIAGALLLLIRWFRRWFTIHAAVRSARKSDVGFPVPAYTSSTMMEPGVFGVVRPILLLPEKLRAELTPEQFDAILAHESRHIQFHDNLTAALHMLVETLFWFHPLVWWIGARLTDERERDCDEAALRAGSRPADYARGIVSVCQNYTESPLFCASGITGSDLKKRIREIMTWSGSLPVTPGGKAMLTAAAIAAISLPFALGILRAQTLPPTPAYGYDAVSIHRASPDEKGENFNVGPQGGLRALNVSALHLLVFAYNIRDFEVIDAPGWMSSERYDITLTPDSPDKSPNANSSAAEALGSFHRNQQRMQAVLRDRFGLVLRTEKRELPIYVLVQAPGGTRITRVSDDHPASLHNNNNHLEGSGTPISLLTNFLAFQVGRPVNDETGLTGLYDYKMDWTPDGAAADPQSATTGPSLFTALREQLGLRLESRKGPATVYIIEKLEHPSEN